METKIQHLLGDHRHFEPNKNNKVQFSVVAGRWLCYSCDGGFVVVVMVIVWTRERE
ncbi:hypothetical protein Hanom_Chr04g00360021 [Helianthus anomalus]